MCDERDAYQQMQLEMTGAMDSASVLRKSSEVERNALEGELAQANRAHTEAMAILRDMLVIVGVRPTANYFCDAVTQSHMRR